MHFDTHPNNANANKLSVFMNFIPFILCEIVFPSAATAQLKIEQKHYKNYAK